MDARTEAGAMPPPRDKSSEKLATAPALALLVAENERLAALLEQAQMVAERRRQALLATQDKAPSVAQKGARGKVPKGGAGQGAKPFPGSNSGAPFESLDTLREDLSQIRRWVLNDLDSQSGEIAALGARLDSISAQIQQQTDQLQRQTTQVADTRQAEAMAADLRRHRARAIALRSATWDSWRNASLRHASATPFRQPGVRTRQVLHRLGRAGRGALLATSGLWSDRFMPALAIGSPTFAPDVFRYAHDRGRNHLQPRAFFDQKYYLAANPDIAATTWSPLLHYIMHGEAEGRDPHPLFDVTFYRETYPEQLKASGLPPLLHFLNMGASEACNPHPLFDVVYYVSQCPDLSETGENPLLHYLRKGWLEGRDPHPLFDNDLYLSRYMTGEERPIPPLLHYVTRGAPRNLDPHALFDGQAYARQHPMLRGPTVNPLVEFLRVGALLGQSPCAEFDAKFYLERNRDVAAHGVNPLLHYVTMGAWEGREPSATFSTSDYLAQNPEAVSAWETPLAHMVKRGRLFGVPGPKAPTPTQGRSSAPPTPDGKAPAPATSISAEAAPRAARRGEAALADYGLPTPRRAGPPPLTDVRLIAFYLPQFHPIPENDAWWGKGFTEWTNVTKAQPQFIGHYQPHKPGDLGYYDLMADETILERQVELARAYGVEGFCLYFYWFAGKRLLEGPIEKLADHKTIDFPFCLCWANENWSRRWDGLDAEILIAQDHSPEDDIAFITHIARYLKNDNHIRIDGKPLLLVYRPSLLPDAKATVERWRQWCRENGVGEIFLGYTQSFESVDPRTYGFDAAIEFPPNNTNPPVITDTISRLNPDFSGVVYDYRVYVERSEHYQAPDYTVFRGVFPAWDNEARRTGRGTVFHHATPARYRAWLSNAAKETVQRLPNPQQRLIFVNAWNEWAEGAHLEPDARHGYAYLEATRDALDTAASRPAGRSVVLVCHDAFPHGAQFLSLHIARVMAHDLGYAVEIVLLGEGPLKSEFELYGRVHDLSGLASDGPEARALARTLADQGVVGAICNTTVSGKFLGVLADAGVRTVSLVHEMRQLIETYGLQAHGETIAAKADKVIFASSPVQQSFSTLIEIDPAKVLLRTQGLYKRNGSQTADARLYARQRLRAHFNLDSSVKVVLGVAYGDHRKGVDLFVDIGRRIMRSRDDVVFLWVGAIDPAMSATLDAALAESGVADRFHFVGFQAQTEDFYAGSDIYAMTSREDPFPTVLMEAFDAALPIVGFEGAGGFDELLRSGCGELAPHGDTKAFAAALSGLLVMPDRRREMGECGRAKIATDYDFGRYVKDLAELVDPPAPTVSVVVPNYNYARFIRQRLESVDAQSVPLHEIVVLDDASTDDSIAAIEKILPTLRAPSRLIPNQTNSGSVFRQWLKGVEACSGELVWIAEADDLAEPTFLQTVIRAFADPNVVLSYCQSRQINDAGQVIAPDYLDYTRDVSAERWRQSYVAAGADEIRDALSIKNTIPNVSGVVFRREALLKVLRDAIREIAEYRVAGDWVTYLKLASLGKVAFSTKALNLHRRHDASVTLGDMNARQLDEIVRVQRLASEMTRLPKATIDSARSYAQALYEQFGLVGDHRKIADDPRFTDILVPKRRR